MSIKITLFLLPLMGVFKLNAQDVKYEGGNENQTMILVLHPDSTYNFKEWQHLGNNWEDKGSWKVYCDLLILNSEETILSNTRQKKNEPKKIRPIFLNSCFIRIDDNTIVYDKGYTMFYLRIKSN